MNDSIMHAMAGAGGGVLAMTATYPLVFLSTRAAVKTQSENKSVYQAVMEVLEREGVLGLYSGLSSSLLGIAVTNGVYYYFYERSKGIFLTGGKKGLTTIESILTGLIAGSATTIISNPLWVVQTSQAVHTMDPNTQTKNLGFLETVQHILAKFGMKGFFRGIGPALVLVVNPVIQYSVFEQLKNILASRRKLRRRGGLTDWDFFVLGAISKLVATSITYPYIVIKARLQAGATKYKSSLNALATILRDEGIEGLYKGMRSKLLQSVLTAAILFAFQRRIFLITKAALTLAPK
ncbi:mitochondrial carrier [Lentinula edodes]|uniref:Mitochondrial carrier n=2 Tax=Lentinula TaxID=5352 RepID=A0A1Q3EDM1_LENED|nr:peroxisomal membrane protein [Lentinula edodes]KAH7879789.1 peroxisomal membrane protein [Lentinula edodes]KAJ4481505.1 peroxisomal membrane protein [Lentinula edodes]GAW05296.1 mitochondrial carrier [Lentinula edodes]